LPALGLRAFERFKEPVEPPFIVHQLEDVPHLDIVSGRKVRRALFKAFKRWKRVLLDEEERNLCTLGRLEELRSRAPAAG